MIFNLNTESVALMVIDMQKGFVDKDAAMEVPAARKIIPNVQLLIDCCRSKQVPVIFTRFVYSNKVPNLIGALHPQHKSPINCCMLGDKSVEVVDALQPLDTELVVDKHGYDAFHHTNLDYALRSIKRQQLIFTGVMTDICVLSTVASALHHEYQVWVANDATATLWDNVQEVTIDLCRRAYGMVSSTEDLVLSINQSEPIGNQV